MENSIFDTAKFALGFIDSQNAFVLRCIKDKNLADVVSHWQQVSSFSLRLNLHLAEYFFKKVKSSHLRVVK